MKEFFLSTRIFKKLGSSENEINAQLKDLEIFIKDIAEIDPIFSNWYVNNASESSFKAPLDYPFPSDIAKNYLFNLKKNDDLESYLLWNGLEEKESYASFNFDSFGLMIDVVPLIRPLNLVL